MRRPVFATKTLDDLVIDDEVSFRHVALYADLKEILRRDGYAFRVLPRSRGTRWDRALCLNLTFWGAGSADGGDILAGARIPADVVTHAAWHHLAAHALTGRSGKPSSADALFLGEAIASAFDVYLVGRLLGHAPRSLFLKTQIPAMADVAHDAGLSEKQFERLLAGIARDPDRAFEDLRALLFDVTRALATCEGPEAALTALTSFDGHRFAALLHRYELSNWVLFARAYGNRARVADVRAAVVDHALRAERDPIAWLSRQWVMPALRRASH